MGIEMLAGREKVRGIREGIAGALICSHFRDSLMLVVTVLEIAAR